MWDPIRPTQHDGWGVGRLDLDTQTKCEQRGQATQPAMIRGRLPWAYGSVVKGKCSP